jgi:hypothetical protein
MHTFTPRWPAAFTDDPHASEIPSGPYRSADDLIAYAERDRLSLGRTWPEVWHFDSSGVFHCMTKHSTGVAVREMADDPVEVLDSRLVVVEGCPDNWLVIEHRMEWHSKGMGVTEADAEAFMRLRRKVARASVNLLDVVIINDEMRWWSLHELTSGTTQWTFVADRPAAPSCRSLARRSA